MFQSPAFCRSVFTARLIAAALAATAVLAQDKETVWTKVTVEGNVISLAWNKDHPWDKELSSGGLLLIARYSGGGLKDVAEAVAKGNSRGARERGATFTLPEDLRSTPTTSVCLFFQLPNRRVLPVRRSTKQNDDTVGFRYEPWEHRVRDRGTLRDASTRVANAERALTVAQGNVNSQQTLVTNRGWSSPAACDALATPRVAAQARPYGVVPPEQHDDIARRVCVRRVYEARWYADALVDRFLKPAIKTHDAKEAREDLDSMFSSAFMLPEIGGLLQQLKQAGGPSAAGLGAREAQAAEFARDWAKYGASSKDYQPHFGKDDDMLGWVGSASEVATRVLAPGLARSLGGEWIVEGMPPATADDVRSLIGIALDAYGGCVADGKTQLKIQYDQWEALQSSAPQRAASAAAFFARECRQGIDLLDKLKTELATMQAQLAREQATKKAAEQSATTALPAKTQQLNAVSCAQ